jgi:hypothetical protein
LTEPEKCDIIQVEFKTLHLTYLELKGSLKMSLEEFVRKYAKDLGLYRKIKGEEDEVQSN